MVSAGAAYIRDEGTNVAETVRVKKLATYQAQGQVPLVDVFEGRRQLLVYFHMWHDGGNSQLLGRTRRHAARARTRSDRRSVSRAQGIFVQFMDQR